MSAVRRVKCILSVNTGDGIMDLVKPQSEQCYPEWKVASPIRTVTSPTGVGSRADVDEVVTAPAAEKVVTILGDSSRATNVVAEQPEVAEPRESNSPFEEEDAGLAYVQEATRRAQQIARKTTMTGLSLQEGDTATHLKSIIAESSLIRPFVDDDGRTHDFAKKPEDHQPYSPHHKVAFHSKLPLELREEVTNWREGHPSSPEEVEAKILGGIDSDSPPPKISSEKQEEDDILNSEFLTSLWTQHIFAVLAGRRFGQIFLEKNASQNITGVVSPFIQRQMKKQAAHAKRTSLATQRFQSTNPPKPQVLKVINTFFVDWPLHSIQELTDRMVPTSFHKGDVLFHEGDYCNHMFLIAQGAVEIIVKDGHCKEAPKSRHRRNGVSVATLNHGELVGDNAMLRYGEPRCATALCTTNVDVWSISRKDFIACSATIPPISHLRFRRMADDKRRDNMRNVFPVKSHNLSTQREFHGFHSAGIQYLASKFIPQIFRAGDESQVLCGPESQDASMFFIVSGAVMLCPTTTSQWPTPGCGQSRVGAEHSGSCASLGKSKGRRYPRERLYRAGDVLGIHETVCNEQLQATFNAHGKGPVEVWCLARQDWLDVAREYPQCAVGTMDEIQKMKCQELPIATENDDALIKILLKNPLVQYCIPSDVLKQVWSSHAILELYRQGSALFHAGDNCLKEAAGGYLYIVEEGSLYDGYTRDALSKQRENAKMHSVEQSPQASCAQAGYVVVDSQEDGYVYGLKEFALQKDTFDETVKCASHCRIWKLSRSALEEAIHHAFPFVLPQIIGSRSIILDHLRAESQLSDLSLLPEGPTCLIKPGTRRSSTRSAASGKPTLSRSTSNKVKSTRSPLD